MPDIDENSPTKSVAFAQTLLRSVVGLILIGHGAQKLVQIAAFSATLTARLAIPVADADAIAYAAAGIELVAGAGLILGWFTRLSAFTLVCASGLAFALDFLRVGALHADRTGFELTFVLVSAGILFMFAGGGPISLDKALRDRRRRKAIENDAIWSRPEYVGTGHHAAD
jgi:uncharacterized membrane protein YphA (DoxX/SURF4 family)